MNRERDRQEGSEKPGGSMCGHFHSSDAESKERREEGRREREEKKQDKSLSIPDQHLLLLLLPSHL